MTDSKIIDALNALAVDGRLTPDDVVAEARKKDSPLHEYFASRDCWDAKKAQAHYCVDIARELIRSIRVEVTTSNFTVQAPAFVRDPSAGAGQGYATLSRLRSDLDVAREAVMAEFSRASSALARARAVAVALDLANEIGELREQVDTFARERLAANEAASH